jgi:hypothetical protein
MIINVKANTEDWWNPDWKFRKEITIDHDLIVSNQVNFPILFHNISNNFSKNAQSLGYDFTFISADGFIKYNHEIEYYNSTKGELFAWVNISKLSSTANTIFYVYYGNPSCSNQENITGTWDSNFKAVYHMNDYNKSKIFDSTQNNNDGYKSGENQPHQEKGKIGYGQNYSGGDYYINHGNDESLNISNNVTYEIWVKINSDTNWRMLFEKNYPRLSTGSEETKNKPYFETSRGHYSYANGTLSIGKYGYVVGTFNGSIISCWLNSEKNIKNDNTSIDNNGDYVVSGAKSDMSGSFLDGILDEMRISNVVRCDSWIKTSFNTMNYPDTFLTVGDEEINPNDNIPPTVEISVPQMGCIYFTLFGQPYEYIPPYPFVTLIIGKLNLQVNATDNIEIGSVKIYIDDIHIATITDPEPPPNDHIYTWFWTDRTPLLQYYLKAVARDTSGNEATDMIRVWRVQILE